MEHTYKKTSFKIVEVEFKNVKKKLNKFSSFIIRITHLLLIK